MRSGDVPGEDGGPQPIGGRVGALDGLLLGLEFSNGYERTKDLFLAKRRLESPTVEGGGTQHT